MVVNVKDPLAGLTQVFYFTSRGTPGNGHLVILDDAAPLVLDFVPADMSRPYGIAVDTAHKKVYITDYYNQAIYRFDPDGKNPQKILDATVLAECSGVVFRLMIIFTGSITPDGFSLALFFL